MREMKDSGIEWIGEIPKDWEITKIGMLYNLRITKVSDTDYAPLSVTKMGVLPQLETVAKTNAHDDRKLVKKGDFVINSRSDRRGSCGISDYYGSVSLINIVLEPKNNMSSGYYSCIFKTVQFADEFYKNGHGIVDDLWTTGWQDMKRIILPVPHYSEQQQIANYLDTKCSEIDATAEDIQKEISLLEDYKKSVITEAVTKGLNPDAEMKDSKIFYLGKINKTWNLTKVGYCCKKLYRPFEPSDEALVCSNKGKVVPRGDTLIGLMTSDDNAMQGICKGDIAIHGMDTWHGAIACSDYDGKITRVVHVCKADGDNRFVVYWLQHLAFVGVYKLISNGVRGNTSDFRSWEKVKDIYIPLPKTRDEQKRICDYIDSVCREVEIAIENKKEQLLVLEELKKTVIYEYVTGKKEVPADVG